MGLDDEIGAARMTTQDMRWGTCLALAALAVGMLMIMGMWTKANAGPQPVTTFRGELTTTAAGDALAGAHSVSWIATDPLADRTIHTGGIPVVEGVSLIELSRAASAERHIQIGILLIIVSLMAATTFSLWRWQLRGLISEAANRDA